MIKIITKYIFVLFQFKTKTTEEISKERFQYNIASSLVALSFLVFFMFIDKIPVEYVLKIFSLFTEDWFKASLVMITVSFVFISYFEKNFSYVFLISIFLLGHFLFVNVYADNYSIEAETSQKIKKKKTMHYNLYQNLA